MDYNLNENHENKKINNEINNKINNEINNKINCLICTVIILFIFIIFLSFYIYIELNNIDDDNIIILQQKTTDISYDDNGTTTINENLNVVNDLIIGTTSLNDNLNNINNTISDMTFTGITTSFSKNVSINGNLTFSNNINNVSSDTFSYLDATSSIQTQLNELKSLIGITALILDNATFVLALEYYFDKTGTISYPINVKNGDLGQYINESTRGNISSWNISAVDSFDCNLFTYSHGTLFNESLNWDVSNVTNMTFNNFGFFSDCVSFKGKGLENWNTKSLTSMYYLFSGCINLDVDFSYWDVSKITTCERAFSECKSLKGTGIDKWNPISLTNINYMFFGCSNMNVNLSCLKNSSITKMEHTFERCKSFEGSGLDEITYTLPSNLSNLFFGCHNLNVDLSLWLTENVTNMDYMFLECKNLDCDLSIWNTQKVELGGYYNMFRGATKMIERGFPATPSSDDFNK